MKAIVEYWLKTSKHDYETMLILFNAKKYSNCLFYGHIVLEKILKALVVKATDSHAKPIHNLLILCKQAEISLEREELEFLSEVNKFNLKARYPDYKLSFYKLCTYKYTKAKLEKIKSIYKKLCKILEK